jgi:hypothetical protein
MGCPAPEWLTGEYVDKKRSAGSIAKELGVSDKTVFRWLRKHRISTRCPSDKSYCSKLPKEPSIVADLYNKPMPLSQIAKQYGVSISAVCSYMIKHGIPRRPQGHVYGEHSPTWKGGKINNRGYEFTRVSSHPRVAKCGYVATHVLVMENEIGRYLADGEKVHHKNGIKNDNRPENLELFATDRDHQLYEAELLLFVKQALFGDTTPSLKPQLMEAFTQFRKAAK